MSLSLKICALQASENRTMDLDGIKRKVNLIDYAKTHYGYKCDSKGRGSCLLHPPDKHNSFSIWQTNNGIWRFKCFHKDKSGSIIDLKMELESLSKEEACSQLIKEFKEGKISPFLEKKKAGLMNQIPNSKRWTVPKEEKKIKKREHFNYKDQDGKIVYRKVKLVYEDGSKQFLFQHLIEGKGWDWTKGKVEHVPYNLDKFKGHEHVIVCEGEKDADTITRLDVGYLATTAPTGKSAWPDPITPYFRIFKKTTFCYDVGNEEDVQRHASTLQKAYPDMEISIIQVPMKKRESDITDYLQTFKTQKEKQMAFLNLLDKSKRFTPEKAPEDHAHMINVAETETKPIQWLWHHVFPIGKVSLLIGDGGAGKSYFANYMASRITTGRDWIGPEKSQPVGKVIIITTEDGVADTIKARAILMGTDQTKLIIIDGISKGMSKDVMSFTLGKNIDLIEKAIVEIKDVRLLVFDPITEFMGNIDDHRTAPTRTALAPLAALAEKYNIAIIIISHLNKDDAKKIIYRTTGSQSYVNMARAVWAIAEDEKTKDRRLLTPVKQNLSKKPDGFAFSITDDKGIVFEKGRVKIVADDVFGTEDQKFERSQIDEAKEFLLKTLSNGSFRANDIFKDAHQAGISEKTLRRAKTALNVIAIQTYDEGKRFWIWKQKK